MPLPLTGLPAKGDADIKEVDEILDEESDISEAFNILSIASLAAIKLANAVKIVEME